MEPQARRAVGVLAVAPLFLAAAGVAGVGGAAIALAVIPRFENFFVMPVLFAAFAVAGFSIGGAVGLAVLLLLAMPLAHRLGITRARSDE